MNLLARVLLSSVLVFSPAVSAQDTLSTRDSCEIPPALKIYTADMDGKVSAQIVDILADRVNCLDHNVMRLNDIIKGQSESNEDLRTKLSLSRDELEQSQVQLHDAEIRIDALEANLHLIVGRLGMAEDEIKWLTPKSRAATSHPANKSDARKPNTPAKKSAPTNSTTAPAGMATGRNESTH